MRSPWPRYGHLDPDLFYDRRNEMGHDCAIPPAPNQRFQYQPDPFSNRLVALQTHIHQHHRQVEETASSLWNALFVGKRHVQQALQWSRREVPPVLPDLGLMASCMLAAGASHPPGAARWSWVAAFGLGSAFVLFPRLRERACSDLGLGEPMKVAGEWWHGQMLQVADGWEFVNLRADRLKQSVANKQGELKNWWQNW